MRAIARTQDRSAGPASSSPTRSSADPGRILLARPAGGAIQARLTVNRPGDEYEQEADRVSAQVMAMPEPRPPQACACGGGCPRCRSERRGAEPPIVQTARVRGTDAGQSEAPAEVHEVLRSPGRPLDAAAAAYFEPRFGHDFGRVRVHTDARAAESARAMDAQAYAVGRDLVFAGGMYQPGTEGGRRLIAHELAHVVQQSGAGDRPGMAQRACLPDAECATPKGAPRAGSAKAFGEKMEAQEAPRREAKVKEAPQVAQAQGHGLRAVEVEQLFHQHLPQLRPLIHAVFVDDTLPPDAAAGRVNCLKWAGESLPPGANRSAFAGAGPDSSCIRIPKALEDQATVFNRNNQALPDPQLSRDEWLRWMIVRVLTHEVTHVRLNAAPIAFPSTGKCTKDALAGELGELAAVISEFPIVKGLAPDLRAAWAKAHLTDPRTAANPGESIFGSLLDIRCSCECPDADALIRAAFDVASASWSEGDRKEFHVYMQRGAGKALGKYWPYDAARVGRVGSHELSFTGGVAFSGPDRLSVAMLTYRYVLSNWADGRLRLTGGVDLNLAPVWEDEPRGELGAATVGLKYVSRPVSRGTFGGFTARLDTGFGAGDFALRPAAPGDAVTTGLRGDWILQVGGGVQFFIPRLTDRVPVSFEAALRLAQPLDREAERIKTVNVSLGIPF